MNMTSTGEMSSTGDESSCTADCPDPGICGDGIRTPDEICDDGNETPEDGCESDCIPTPGWPCGDGQCVAPEDAASCARDCPAVCDDGTCDFGEDANTCPQDCTATCGQGTCEPGEDPENCIDDCKPGICPNNHCDPGEDPGSCSVDCDADVCGNHVCEHERMENDPKAPDFCDEDCDPECGDGVQWGPNEGCDDGNQFDEDECSNQCVRPRYTFLTKQSYKGDLGGLDGADILCTKEAADHSLPGTYQAWLSDSTGEVATRFMGKDFSGLYRLPVTHAPVARGWLGLTTMPLMNAITIGPDGEDYMEEVAWSNTSPDGSVVTTEPLEHCNNWTSAADPATGRVGYSEATNAGWTDKQINGCGLGVRLYCFQVAN